MSIEYYRLEDAREQLQQLFDRLDLADIDDTTYRSTIRQGAPSLLSAGVVQYGGVLVWYSLTAEMESADPDKIAFHLETSTDSSLPPNLILTCAIGRSSTAHLVRPAHTQAWSAPRHAVIHPRAKRVESAMLSLELREDAG
jgi:hypothetical protein